MTARNIAHKGTYYVIARKDSPARIVEAVSLHDAARKGNMLIPEISHSGISRDLNFLAGVPVIMAGMPARTGNGELDRGLKTLLPDAPAGWDAVTIGSTRTADGDELMSDVVYCGMNAASEVYALEELDPAPQGGFDKTTARAIALTINSARKNTAPDFSGVGNK